MGDNNDWSDKICEFCGAECWFDEMKTHEKCWTCYVQDCRHVHTDKEYQGSTQNRVRFLETCLTCESEREILFFFDFELKPKCTHWTNENVSQDDMEAYQ